jgi:histone H1/5
MYITADAGDNVEGEAVLAPAKSVYGIGGPTSVDSTDVQKAGTIFTNTPDGRMRLTDYLTNVEKEIAAEEAARKRDVAAVRAQMDRNFAFNQAARKKLKKALLHKMAVNAKKAKDDLARAMRFVQGRFHRAAALANRRNRANIRRSKKIRARVARDKAHAAHQLRIAVKAQQRSMAAYKSAINARIAQTNKHVAVNAAQIKENAKAARKALEGAVSKFDKKVANARAEAAKGRSKLAAQLAAQDKATRQWANNKLKVVVAKTAAHFRRVRAKMAADRHHADMALKSATSRMTASLNAAKALNDRNFAKTVKDIAAAKAEAKSRVAAAKTEFKTKINLLRATVKQQVAKTNARITQLTGTVNKNKLEQAKVNANVRAETNRMIKVGNKRYQEHLKKDRELKNLIKSNKAATDARLKAMADHYSTELDKVRSTMKKNRAHASHMLAKETGKLYAAIAKSEKAQMKINGKLAAQTRNARLDIADELRSAKSDFSKRMAALHGNIVRNDKKFEGKMDKLAGVVRANAVKNARGRSQLAAIMKANKMELKAAVQGAVHKGEVRMMKAEQKLKDMNKKTKSSLNMRITSEVSKLAKESASQIENLRLSSKAARGEMRRELLYAVRSAAAEAKKNLVAAVKMAKKCFSKANAKERAAARKNAAGRAAIARSIASSKRAAKRQLNDAVGAMNRSLLALKTETAKKIKKSNHKVTAFAGALAKEAKDVDAAMKANMNSLTAKINAARRSAASATRAANAKSAAGFRSALKSVASAMGAAQRRASNKFGKLYRHMAADRARADSALAASVKNINDGIAKQAALADSRFSKTVKNIAGARAQAAKQVSDARKTFATSIAATVSAVKDQESRLSGEIAVVSGEVARNRAIQLRVNRRTNAELKRITKLSNDRHSASIRARGKLRALLDENKRAASEEVGALNKLFVGKLSKIRRRAAKDRIEAARDLSKASQRMYSKLAGIQLRAAYQNKAASAAIKSYSKKSQAAIRIARSSMNARLNTLGNVIASNARKVESGMEVLTGVIRSHRAAGALDRKLIREQTKAMGKDMQKSIARSIMIGEAKARRVADRARGNLARAKRAMLIEISERVEHTADKLFKSIQGSHQKIADNYLSLKAYAVTAGDKLKDYVIKGKGKNLSSLGDLLTTVAGLSSVKAQKAEGLGAGAKSIPAIFSAKKVKVKAMLTKINGLVNEYTGVINAVRARWPMGLGKYLLLKLEESMLTKGVLQVDKVSNHAGNWVFLNGRAVGLSNKLNDFESLAVRMGHYEATLAKLTAALAGKKHKPAGKKPYSVPAPEWPGN